MFSVCSKCNKKMFIVNKTYNLCDDCNTIRLHGKTKIELYFDKLNKKREDYNSTINRDERFYEYIFNLFPCECQECGKPLNIKFRNERGKVINRWQYSHILSKGGYPKLRWHKNNCNKLCLDCHQIWDFGDKENMKIYEENQKLIQLMKENPNNLVL